MSRFHCTFLFVCPTKRQRSWVCQAVTAHRGRARRFLGTLRRTTETQGAPHNGENSGKPLRSHPKDKAGTSAAVPQEEVFSSCTQGPSRRPEAMAHACCLGPSLVTPSTTVRSRGPFQAGGQAPPFHRVTKSRQGEFHGIPSRGGVGRSGA